MPEAAATLLPWVDPGGQFYLVLSGLVATLVALRALARRRWGMPRVVHAERRAESLALTLCFLTILIASIVQIVLRNLFHRGLIWIDPLARHLVLWIAFFGALAAAGKARHIAIDALPLALPPRARAVLRRVVWMATAAICAVLANGGLVYLRQEREFGGEALPGVPTWAAQRILFFGFVLLTYRFAAAAVHGAEADEPAAPAAPVDGAAPDAGPPDSAESAEETAPAAAPIAPEGRPAVPGAAPETKPPAVEAPGLAPDTTRPVDQTPGLASPPAREPA